MNLAELYLIPQWEREPAQKQFEYKGYSCLIKRNPTMLFLCGYVAIPEFDEEIDDYMLEDLSPHGGITFNEYPSGDYLPRFNDLGQRLYWVGFDCGHACDMTPGIYKILLNPRTPTGIYRNMSYVEKEIKNMVDQIIESIKNHGGRQR